MYKNNDEAIDWEVRRLIKDGVYADIEQAYAKAIETIHRKREEVKVKQVKDYFRFRIKTIKKRKEQDLDMIMQTSRINRRDQWLKT